jgi:hypothetical protein
MAAPHLAERGCVGPSRRMKALCGSIKSPTWPVEEGTVIEVEVIGNEVAINAAKAEIAQLTTVPVRDFHHKGVAGEAGVYGLLTSVLTATVPKLVEMLKGLVAKDRNLKISFNGFELVVRDIEEATDVLDLLEARGILRGSA